MKFDPTPTPRRRQPILLERLEGRLLFDAAQLSPDVVAPQTVTSPSVRDVAHTMDLAEGSEDAAPPAASTAAVDHATDAGDRILAFPGAEGMGAYAQGGRGGDVYHVTSLDDYGTGTLREGVNSANGPRTIVFDVSGTIALSSWLEVDDPYLTIAGQTAPGDGITLRNHGLTITDTHDIIVRYMRFRPGDTVEHEEDALLVYNSHDVLIDHVSASWAVDETIDTSKSDNVTVQWSIIAEGLHDSSHHKGPHSTGSIHTGGGISMHHNLFISNNRRSPLVRQQADVVNNVMYNWGTHATIVGWSDSTPDPFGITQVNLQGNYYIAGPSTTYEYSSLPYLGHVGSELWHSDNLVDMNRNGTLDGVPLTSFLGSSVFVNSRFDYPLIQIDDPLTAYNRVLDEVGASLSRDAVDQRLVNEVISETGRIIDSQNEVGGWPTLQSTTAPRDSDGDGMPDAWEDSLSHLNRLDATDGNRDANGDGLTHLEDYLAVVAAGDPALGITGPQSIESGDSAVFTWNSANPLFDPRASDVFAVDWDGDGQADQTWEGQLGAPVEHVFDQAGPHDVIVVWTGPTGQTSHAVHRLNVTAPAPALEIDLQGPRQVEADVTAIFTVAAISESPNSMQSYVFDIDWNENGRADQRLEGPLGIGVEHRFEAPGVHAVKVTLTDADGRQTTASHEVKVTAPAPAPEIAIQGPRQVDVGVNETFAVVAADGASGDAQSYTIDIDWDGDGSVDEQVQGPLGKGVPHAFEEPGTYVVEAVLTDSRDRHTTSTLVVEVTAPLSAPEIDILAPRQVLIDEPVVFTIVTAGGAPDNGQPYTFDIDWTGDGRIDQRIQGPLGLEIEHTFEDPGTYVVEFVLTDARGRHATSTLVVDVALPRPAPAGPDVTSNPAIRMDGPSVLEAGEVSAFTLAAADASLDHEQTYLFAIDWIGDGRIDQVIEGHLGTRIEHAFDNWGKYSVRVSLLDQQGIERASGGTQVLVTEGLPDRIEHVPGPAADSIVPSPLPAQRDSGGEGRVMGGKFLSAAGPATSTSNPESSSLAKVLEKDGLTGSTYELSAQRIGLAATTGAAEEKYSPSESIASHAAQDIDWQEMPDVLDESSLHHSDDRLGPPSVIENTLGAVVYQANPAERALPVGGLSAQPSEEPAVPAPSEPDQMDDPAGITGEELLMESGLEEADLIWALTSEDLTSESTDLAADGEVKVVKDESDKHEVKQENESRRSEQEGPGAEGDEPANDTRQSPSPDDASSESGT